MTLVPGTRLGPYEILSPLGAGGMGEVYRAKDTRLGREVAIKVLPEHLSANEEIRARFEREAKTVSSLNHPNICTLFDVGREGSTDYLVMELIEGETLAQRLRKGPLAGAELLRIGVQMADALDRAHRASVIHRDLKPGNIMLTRSGAKLMDFGLARAADAAKRPGSGTSGSALTQSPTVAQALTTEGTIVGTYQYMAPEQLEGHEADARSDIWALGCVLYEMATSKRAFEGRSQATLIAAIIGSQPAPLAEAPSGSPPTGDLPPAGLDRLVRACLAKDPEDRVQTAHAVKQQLQWIAEGSGFSAVGVPTPIPGAAAPITARSGGSRLAWAVAGVAVLAGAVAVAWLWPRAYAPRPSFRFATELPAGATDYSWPRVSPDGRQLVFVGVDSAGASRAWLRPLDQSRAVPIAGSEGVRRMYWSPDGKEIAFVAAGKIQRLPITGGAPIVVCETQGGADLDWGSKGTILMDGTATDSLLSVPARGGELRPAARIDRASGESGSAWPHFLPDGEHFLFIGNRANVTAGGNIRLGKLGTLDSKLLGTSDGRAEYAAGGWVIYLKGTTLLARKLDIGAGKLTGQPLTLAENVRKGSAAGHFSSSPSGVLAWSRGAQLPLNTLEELDRAGKRVGGTLTTGLVANPALSPDGRRVLFERVPGPGADPEILVRDLDRGTETKLTFEGGAATAPRWSPDGRRFACMLVRDGVSALLIGSSDGLGRPDTIPDPAGGSLLTQWAEAGSRLVLVPPGFRTPFAVNPDSAGSGPRPIAGLSGLMAQCAISPDGRWMAYGSNEGGGQVQVYVQSLTGTPGRWQVTAGGGYMPQWTKGGDELVYESASAIMAVTVDTKESFRVGTPVRLFDVPQPLADANTRYWTVSRDGQRFFAMNPPRNTASRPIEVVTDVRALLNRK